MLPQSFLPLIRLLADRACMYPFAVVLYHVHLQSVLRVKRQITFLAFMIPLVQMVPSDMAGKVPRGDVTLRAGFAFISLELLVMDLCEMLLSSVERTKRDIAPFAGISHTGFMLLGHMVLPFRDPIEHCTTISTRKRPDFMSPHVTT